MDRPLIIAPPPQIRKRQSGEGAESQ
eukprot:COSAG03_NODE_17969_length_364_cov_1.158491_1_plen_25_part_01